MDPNISLFFTIRGYFESKREVHAELMTRPRPEFESEKLVLLRKRISIAASTFYIFLLESETMTGPEFEKWIYSLYLAIKMFTSKSRIVFVIHAFLNHYGLPSDETYSNKVLELWNMAREKELEYLPLIVKEIQKHGRPNYWEKLNLLVPKDKDKHVQEYALPWIYLALTFKRIDIPIQDFVMVAKSFSELNFKDHDLDTSPSPSPECWLRFRNAFLPKCSFTILELALHQPLEKWQEICPVVFPKTRIQLEKMFQLCKQLYN